MKLIENEAFLKEQIITYLGNKRALLGFLQNGFNYALSELKRPKFSFCDMFSGSGIVSRFAKKYASKIYANDLENYSKIINECYLANENEINMQELKQTYAEINECFKPERGFISELYAPKNDDDIKENERVFYTQKNAQFLDGMRMQISKIKPNLQPFFIAPLIYEASVHSNTSGVFKGFYKGKNGLGKFGGEGENALSRIKGEMKLGFPVFSNFTCECEVLQMNANTLASELDSVDVAYLDPPYNQHPYGSNYFMLNLIANYERPSEISKISGIAKGWNKSDYNKAKSAENTLFELIFTLRAKIVLLSYNCEGFVKKEKFLKRLESIGKVELLEQKYNAFRASRNLANRNTHVSEQLYIIKK